MTMPEEIVRLPDPLVAAQWAGVVRHALTYGGGALSALGVAMPSWLSGLSDPQLNLIVSAVIFFGGLGMGVVGFVMSQIDKRRARGREVAAAITSVEKGTPVTVTVTPSGQPNIATKISADELNKAPTVPFETKPQPAPRPA